MLKPITQKVTDESKEGEYCFTFYCDICGRAHQSPRYHSASADYADPGTRKAEYEDAYARANSEMVKKFNRCPVCQRVVCDECYDIMDDINMCKACHQQAEADAWPGSSNGSHRLRLSIFAVAAAACLILVVAGVGLSNLGIGDPAATTINDGQVPLAAYPDGAARVFTDGSQTVTLWDDGSFSAVLAGGKKEGVYAEEAENGPAEGKTITFTSEGTTADGAIEGDILTLPEEWDGGAGTKLRRGCAS
jgi:hypothetical protein